MHSLISPLESGLEPESRQMLEGVLRMADMGWKAALKANANLAAGLNVHAGQVTYEAVAKELGYAFVPVTEIL